MTDRTAIVLGASGSIGQALLAQIVRCGRYRQVLVVARRPLDLQLGEVVEQRLVPDMCLILSVRPLWMRRASLKVR